MISTIKGVTTQFVPADGWILTAKLALYLALGFIRFMGESTSLQGTQAVSPQFIPDGANDEY
jgi:hypothetical protein